MHSKHLVRVLLALAVSGVASPVYAQAAAPPERRWSIDVSIGWDNGISGNINSGGIGVINGQTSVILKNTYEDIYGKGLNLRFGGGVLLREDVEARASFTFQSFDADLTRMGDLGVSNLYGQYSDYQSLTLDVGLRKYATIKTGIRAYGEAMIGLGFIDAIDVVLSAPSINYTGNNTDFYDQTAAFTFSFNGGVLFDVNPKTSIFGQLGLRFLTGMSEVDVFANTSLETINDNSARWSIPFSAGVRFRF